MPVRPGRHTASGYHQPVTVAAVVLAASPDSAVADADGMPSVRRIADVAWAGGAVPIVVVADDPDGSVAQALAGSAVTLAEPAPADHGPVGQIVRGVEVAMAAINETLAALVWPATMTWVGPETVTSLIEAHGPSPDEILRPAFDGANGWPALVPLGSVGRLAALAADRTPDDLLADLASTGVGTRTLDLGDPGAVHDRSTPRSSLPAYSGPAQPAAGHMHEWGAGVADHGDDHPLEGPSLAPYGQAVAEDPGQPG